MDIDVNGQSYGSWDEVPDDVRAAMQAAGADMGEPQAVAPPAGTETTYGLDTAVGFGGGRPIEVRGPLKYVVLVLAAIFVVAVTVFMYWP